LQNPPTAVATTESPRRGVERFAWWLDSAIVVPGTRFRIGIDALVGLIPGVGDVVGALLSSYIIAVAAREGAPAAALLRMAINVGIESLIGAIPLVGDLFDAAWRANERNVRLLRQHRTAPHAVRRQSKAVVAGWLVGVGAVLVGLAAAAFAVVRWVAMQVAAA
jgi:hypothetical protein